VIIAHPGLHDRPSSTGSLGRVMRTRVTRSFTFDAAHVLPWHPGRCRNLHGHTYRVEVSIEGPLGPHGIVTDFADLDAVVRREATSTSRTISTTPPPS
jgi:hypothetical protein